MTERLLDLYSAWETWCQWSLALTVVVLTFVTLVLAGNWSLAMVGLWRVTRCRKKSSPSLTYGEFESRVGTPLLTRLDAVPPSGTTPGS